MVLILVKGHFTVFSKILKGHLVILFPSSDTTSFPSSDTTQR